MLHRSIANSCPAPCCKMRSVRHGLLLNLGTLTYQKFLRAIYTTMVPTPTGGAPGPPLPGMGLGVSAIGWTHLEATGSNEGKLHVRSRVECSSRHEGIGNDVSRNRIALNRGLRKVYISKDFRGSYSNSLGCVGSCLGRCHP